MSNEKDPGYLLYMDVYGGLCCIPTYAGIILPTYVGIIMHRYKDPY